MKKVHFWSWILKNRCIWSFCFKLVILVSKFSRIDLESPSSLNLNKKNLLDGLCGKMTRKKIVIFSSSRSPLLFSLLPPFAKSFERTKKIPSFSVPPPSTIQNWFNTKIQQDNHTNTKFQREIAIANLKNFLEDKSNIFLKNFFF